MNQTEQNDIRQVVEWAYIQGIHGDQNAQMVKSGFHPDFAMLVLHKDALGFDKVTVDEWLTRIEMMKADNPELWSAQTTYTFELVDVSGYAAVAKLQVYKGTTHFSTDYMLLYKFADGWKIVSKTFSIPR